MVKRVYSHLLLVCVSDNQFYRYRLIYSTFRIWLFSKKKSILNSIIQFSPCFPFMILLLKTYNILIIIRSHVFCRLLIYRVTNNLPCDLQIIRQNDWSDLVLEPWKSNCRTCIFIWVTRCTQNKLSNKSTTNEFKTYERIKLHGWKVSFSLLFMLSLVYIFFRVLFFFLN